MSCLPICFLLLVVCSPAQAWAESVAPGLLRLRFDFGSVEGDIVRDASGHGHDGKLEGKDGDLPKIVETPYGKALRLEKGKGQGIRVGYSEQLDGAEGLTVMAWVKPAFTRAHLAILANKGDHVPGRKTNGYRLSIAWNTLMMDLGFGRERGERLQSEPWSMEPNFWTHTAMTFDGQEMALFINAEKVAAKRLPERRQLTPFRRPFTIGKYFWHDAYPFAGLLSDVRIYAGPLKEEAIFAAAAEFLSGHASGLRQGHH